MSYEMKRKILILGALLLSGSLFAADNSPLWLRKNSISPDGKNIAFGYQGDIFVVSAEGGRALQITSNEAYDSDPIWTPDGKHIVFSSYRDRSKDIFMTSPEGGAPVKITDYPGNETPLAVLPDGNVIFSANLQADAQYGDFPGENQRYMAKRDR